MASSPAAIPCHRATLPKSTWPRYRDNLARHLIGISRDLQSRVMHRLGQDLGYAALRPSFGPFMSLIWDEGRPLTAIASELAISNQACSQLANHAEAAGYLERRPNPEDRRSKLVMLTARGRLLVETGIGVILESESEYSDLLGESAYRRFTAAIDELYHGLGLPTHADPALNARVSHSIAFLPLVAVRIQRDLMQATAARGHPGLKMSHAQILPLIGPEGGRIHEIARIQRISRQAISATSKDLERLGYVCRKRDPSDRRGVVLSLTERGVRLIDDSVAAVDGLEACFREILGAEPLEHLQHDARDLYHALHLEVEILEANRERSTPSSSALPRGRTNGARDATEIDQLASRLRRLLGGGDAARLAAALEPGASGVKS